MQIQINLRITTVPEMKTVEPIVTAKKMYTLNTMKTEEPEQWSPPLRLRTVMGVEGSTAICITFVENHLGRVPYTHIRMAYDL